MASNMKPQKPQFRRAKAAVARHQGAHIPQDPRRNYERYLALARAEALAGDRIAAENYFQHAEHYFRSMHRN
ncbi:DUF4167 domain-containing protein [Bradyrhizobium diazoefficiens]|nr:DUF4167 domain-containing protein [Bradyrhizobium diazoefficiens]